MQLQCVSPGELEPGLGTLDRLPTEIVEVLCKDACTDGGRTAYSLAFVSKRVHNISRAFRFHSVSLLSWSPSELVKLRENLETACRAAMQDLTPVPRVSHLCLDLIPIDGPEADGDLTEENWRPSEAIRLVEEFIQDVSADLETLCLFGFNWAGSWDQTVEFRVNYKKTFACSGFPKLRELSFGGDEPVFNFVIPDQPNDPEPQVMFPALVRLYAFGEALNQMDFKRWFKVAPRLQDLRYQTVIRTLDEQIPDWMESLEIALGSYRFNATQHFYDCSMFNLGFAAADDGPTLKRHGSALPPPHVQLLARQHIAPDAGPEAHEHIKFCMKLLADCLLTTRLTTTIVLDYYPYDVDIERDDDRQNDTYILHSNWLDRILKGHRVIKPNFWADWTPEGTESHNPRVLRKEKV